MKRIFKIEIRFQHLIILLGLAILKKCLIFYLVDFFVIYKCQKEHGQNRLKMAIFGL